MPSTVVVFPRDRTAPGRHALILLDAARAWRRLPGGDAPIPDAIIRRLGAAGLLGMLAPLDGLMLVVTTHAKIPLDLGPPGEPPVGPDARLLAWLLDQAARDDVSEDGVDRLALRVDMGARSLLGAALRRLAGAGRPRVQRGAWPQPVAEPPSEAGADETDTNDPPDSPVAARFAAE